MRFTHLTKINQTYLSHFIDAFSYFRKSFKASFYFLAHAIYPDVFEYNGSNEITELYEIIQEKYRSIKKT